MPREQEVRKQKRLQLLVGKLARLYGEPAPLPVTDPFEVVLFENAAYLVDDARRREVFRELRRKVGVSPGRILAAPLEALAAAIGSGGMRPLDRARKLQEAAEIAREAGLDRLRAESRAPKAGTRKLLKRFPGIGEPGADKILLFSRGAPSLAPDSNALRVLLRLGYGTDDRNYGKSYRSATEAASPELPADFDFLIRAHQLLRQHGQELCKAAHPRCEACPLRAECAWYASTHP